MSRTNESNWKGLAANTAIVFDYLMSGKEISQLIAFNNLGVQSLTSRISQLKKWMAAEENKMEGKVIEIASEWRKDFGGKRYKAYWITGLDGDEPAKSDKPFTVHHGEPGTASYNRGILSDEPSGQAGIAAPTKEEIIVRSGPRPV